MKHPTLKIELIYDIDCPNESLARVRIQETLKARLHQWHEWERSDPKSPAYARRYGSPTILVNGKDVGGLPPADAPCCRLYSTGGGRKEGAPSVAMIQNAFAATGSTPSSRLGVLGYALGIGASILPIAGCPACWPAWVSLGASFGLGFLLSLKWQIALLSVAGLLMFAISLRNRSRWTPWVIILTALGLVTSVSGKALEAPWVNWIGVGFFLMSAIMEIWLGRKARVCQC